VKQPLLTLLCCTLLPAVCLAQDGLALLFTRVNTLIKSGDYAGAVQTNNQLLHQAQSANNCYYSSMATFKAAEIQSFLKNDSLSKQLIYDGMRRAARCTGADTVYWLCIRHLGALYFGRQQRDSAFYYLNTAYQLIRGSQRYSRIASTTGMLGETMRHLYNNMDSAEAYYKISMHNALLSNDYEAIGYANLRYGSFLCNARGNCGMGIPYTEKALQLFDAHHDMEGIVFALRSLSTDYLANKDFDRSRTTMKRLFKTQDSLFRQQVAEKAAYYHELYETEKKDLALKAAAVKRKNLVITFIAAILIAAVVLVWLYNRYKMRRKIQAEKNLAAERLLRFKAVIDTEERERERIARELHDGVGHLLASAKLHVSAIDDIPGDDGQLVTNAMHIIDDALAETRTISHNLAPAALTQLGFTAAINQLARMLNQTGRLRVKLLMDDGVAVNNQSKATAIYRIVQEVLNNTLKHASASLININISVQGNNLIVQVKDDGKGFDTTTITQSQGMGWKNIYARVELLNGHINIHSVINAGTTITIQIPHEQ